MCVNVFRSTLPYLRVVRRVLSVRTVKPAGSRGVHNNVHAHDFSLSIRTYVVAVAIFRVQTGVFAHASCVIERDSSQSGYNWVLVSSILCDIAFSTRVFLLLSLRCLVAV